MPINGKELLTMAANAFKVALPAVVSMIFTMFIQIINIAFIGHVEEDSISKVAAVGLGNLFFNMVGQSVG